MLWVNNVVDGRRLRANELPRGQKGDACCLDDDKEDAMVHIQRHRTSHANAVDVGAQQGHVLLHPLLMLMWETLRRSKSLARQLDIGPGTFQST